MITYIHTSSSIYVVAGGLLKNVLRTGSDGERYSVPDVMPVLGHPVPIEIKHPDGTWKETDFDAAAADICHEYRLRLKSGIASVYSDSVLEIQHVDSEHIPPSRQIEMVERASEVDIPLPVPSVPPPPSARKSSADNMLAVWGRQSEPPDEEAGDDPSPDADASAGEGAGSSVAHEESSS